MNRKPSRGRRSRDVEEMRFGRQFGHSRLPPKSVVLIAATKCYWTK